METESALERVSRASDDLYEADFYAWTQHQAALLRAGELDKADVVHILEEIETLGRKEVSELRSRLRILTAHILKELYQPDQASRSWATTILAQRIALADHLEDNPSLASKLDDAFAEAYRDGRKLASSETGLSLDCFPVRPPFTCEDAFSQAWSPREAVKGKRA